MPVNNRECDCDPDIYRRLNDLEKGASRDDERLKHVEEFIKEMKQDVKSLSKKVIMSEVRLAAVIGVMIWAINHFFK